MKEIRYQIDLKVLKKSMDGLSIDTHSFSISSNLMNIKRTGF